MSTRISLEQLQVPQPCPASWEAMLGNDATRFCQGCGKHVHNLAAMSRSQAQRLICESAGGLCVRFQRAEDGQVVTLGYKPLAQPRYRLGLCIAIATMGAMVASAGGYWLGLGPFASDTCSVPANTAMGRTAVMGDIMMGAIAPPSVLVEQTTTEHEQR